MTWPQSQTPLAVDILSVEGQTVWRQDTPQGGRAELDTQGWEVGVYLVHVELLTPIVVRTAAGLRTTRVIKL